MLIWFPVSLEGAVNYNPWVSRTPSYKICKMFCFTWLRGVFQWYIVRGKNENHFYENNTIRAWLRKK